MNDAALNPGELLRQFVSYIRVQRCRLWVPIVGLDVNLVTVRWYEFLVGYERSHEIRT
jgi:hypothetical protein